MTTETSQSVRTSFDDVARVEIINSKEKVEFKSRSTRGVDIDGGFKHWLLGQSRTADTLYLIAFEGTVAIHDDVVVSYKRGVDDLQKELVDTYAPSLSYGGLLDTSALLRELAPYEDVPKDLALALTHRFTDCTVQPFSAPQAVVSSPPGMHLIERRIRAEAFRWNGPYNFLPKLQAGRHDFVPEFASAHTIEDVYRIANDFIMRKLSVDGPAVSALVRKLNELSNQSAAKLREFVQELDQFQAKAEPQIQALATTIQDKSEQKLMEGLEELRKKRIPYGAMLVKRLQDVPDPKPVLLSNEWWAPVMAECAVREATSSRTDPAHPAPASKTTADAHIDMRYIANVRAALEAKQEFCTTLGAAASHELQVAAQAESIQLNTVRADHLSDWLSNAALMVNRVGTNHFNAAKEREDHWRFKPNPDHATYTIDIKYGADHGDDQFKSGSPTPSPSPSPDAPSSPPTTSTSSEWRWYNPSTW
jgi:hypothetical protein